MMITVFHLRYTQLCVDISHYVKYIIVWVKLNRDNGEFLLSINVPVYCWLLKREMEGLTPLQEVDIFCIVTENLFEDY